MDEQQTERLLECVDGITAEQKIHGEVLARLDERTLNQEGRLNRMGVKSAGTGAASGGLIGLGVSLLAKLFGTPSA